MTQTLYNRFALRLCSTWASYRSSGYVVLLDKSLWHKYSFVFLAAPQLYMVRPMAKPRRVDGFKPHYGELRGLNPGITGIEGFEPHLYLEPQTHYHTYFGTGAQSLFKNWGSLPPFLSLCFSIPGTHPLKPARGLGNAEPGCQTVSVYSEVQSNLTSADVENS